MMSQSRLGLQSTGPLAL